MKHKQLLELTRNDHRYAYEAYEFLLLALEHTQELFGKRPRHENQRTEEHHVNGSEIITGMIDLARKEFGLMARLVFRQWGIHRTTDIGEIVFNLIDAGLLSKNESDCREDFESTLNLERALVADYIISLEFSSQPARGKA